MQSSIKICHWLERAEAEYSIIEEDVLYIIAGARGRPCTRPCGALTNQKTFIRKVFL
jgi:hypothetical protein